MRLLTLKPRLSRSTITQILVVIALIIVLAWAKLAKLDIVVSARGEIVSESDIEKIQHREGGILEELFIKEGSYVHKGQPIARLTALERNSELNAMRVEVTEMNMEAERLSALIEERKPDFSVYTDKEDLIGFHEKIWREEKKKNDDSAALFIHDIEHKKRLMESMRGRLRSSEEQLALIREQKTIKEQLNKEDILPYVTVLDVRIQEKNMEREIQNLREAILNEDFMLQKIVKQLEEMRSSKLSEYLEKHSDLRKSLKIKTEQLPNVTDQVERLVVTSPIDGYVNEIHYNYKSAVISPGESIADVNPIRSGLIGEAKIPRKDIGFIEIGQSVRIKMDTYSFTKYGFIDGKVLSISKNSYEEKEETFYLAKISLERKYLEASGKQYHVSPDMEFAADIKTGSRTVLDYALKPVMTSLQQAFAER